MSVHVKTAEIATPQKNRHIIVWCQIRVDQKSFRPPSLRSFGNRNHGSSPRCHTSTSRDNRLPARNSCPLSERSTIFISPTSRLWSHTRIIEVVDQEGFNLKIPVAGHGPECSNCKENLLKTGPAIN